jgi:hypothetical protein
MKLIKFLTLAGAVAVLAALGVWSAKAGFPGRQYYDGWRPSGKGFYFSTHHYKPSYDAAGYLSNYAIWYPSAPRYVYYFNPAKKTYWGRFDVQTKGYSLLAEKDRAGLLKDIPEKAFPAEGPLPQVPDAKDKVTLDVPPDLPAAEKPGNAAGTADKPEDVTTPPVGDKPADTPLDKPAPAAQTPAPAGTPAPGGAAQVDPSADPKPGTGVAVPPEPVNPPPATGAAGTPVTGGAAAPLTGSAAPADGPAFPGFPSNCKKKFGGYPTHGHGW